MNILSPRGRIVPPNARRNPYLVIYAVRKNIKSLCYDLPILDSYNLVSHLRNLRIMGNHHYSLMKFLTGHF